MTAPVVICDPLTGSRASVTKFGQLIVAPVDYSIPVTVSMSLVDTPYLLVSPSDGKAIVITSAIITANRLVGVNDATISIYSSDTADGAIPASPEITLEMIKSTTLPLTGLNLLIPKGKFLLAQTDDNTVFLTIGYYRVPV